MSLSRPLDRSSSSEASAVLRWLPFVKHSAFKRTDDHFVRDDLIQEGLLAAWRAIRTGKDDGRGGYVQRAVINAITDALVRDAWTSNHKANRAKPKDPLRNTQRVEFDVDKHEQLAGTAQGPYAALRLDLSEVLQAVACLPLREQNIVLRRFWAGYTVSEAARAGGMAAKTAEKLWTNNTKPFLAERLAHLRAGGNSGNGPRHAEVATEGRPVRRLDNDRSRASGPTPSRVA